MHQYADLTRTARTIAKIFGKDVTQAEVLKLLTIVRQEVAENHPNRWPSAETGNGLQIGQTVKYRLPIRATEQGWSGGQTDEARILFAIVDLPEPDAEYQGDRPVLQEVMLRTTDGGHLRKKINNITPQPMDQEPHHGEPTA